MYRTEEVKKVNVAVKNAGPATEGGKSVRKGTLVPSGADHRGLPQGFTDLQEAARAVQRIRLSVQHELELARKLREDAQRYQMEMQTRARSEAQRIVLQSRLASQRQIEEMIHKASEEIQKLLADIRMIRITAQEELAAQRKFTDAARLCSMSLTIQDNGKKREPKRKSSR